MARGRPWLERHLPALRERFPGAFDGVDPPGLERAANRVERSLIRIEADEVTYNIHILIRFELELEIFEEGLPLAELPEAWNARYRDYLGLEVPDDAHGVLQDVHWAGGAFGYFPTYSLGNVIAGQLWEAARPRSRRPAGADRRRGPRLAGRMAARAGPPVRPPALADRDPRAGRLRRALGRAAAGAPPRARGSRRSGVGRTPPNLPQFAGMWLGEWPWEGVATAYTEAGLTRATAACTCACRAELKERSESSNGDNGIGPVPELDATPSSSCTDSPRAAR